jgi:hypothetical protein
MAGVITTGNHPKALWPGIKAWWGRKYNEHPEECKELFDIEGSTQNYEEDVEVTGFGLAPVKNEGKATTYDSETQGTITRYTHIAYSLGYIVTREEIDDDLYEAVSMRRSEALAFSMRQTKENVAANVYNRGFSTTYPGGDGVAMISASHPTVNGTQSNIISVAADLSEQSIEDLCIQIMDAKNSRGLDISLMPKSLHVATANAFEATRILKSPLQNDTANNAINALMEMGSIPKVMVSHYFTDPDAWFIRTNAPRGMVGYTRVPIDFNQDNDFDSENAKAKCYERYKFGFTDFRGIYGSAGA